MKNKKVDNFQSLISVNPVLESYVTKFFGKCAPDAPQMKLCTIPEKAHLIETMANGKKFRYPGRGLKKN